YTINVKNLSGSLSDSVVVTDALPGQVQYLGSTVRYFSATPPGVTNDSVVYTAASHSIAWTKDTVFVGDSAVITLVTRVRGTLEPGDHTYTNIAGMGWKGGTLTSDMDSLSNATVRSFVSYLKVTKQAIRKIVEIGDVATYVVRVTNMSPVSIARDIQVLDKVPFGFKYVNGSSFIDSMRIADPTGKKELLWLLSDSLPAGASIQFVYRLIVGAGAADGNGINTAQAFGVSQSGSPLISAEVQERVEVRRGVFTTHGLIIGKVFYDDNRNLYQDPNEAGVKNVELMMEDGMRILTGDDGKYSIPDVLPGEHVIRVRTHTLPKDASLEMGYNDFAGDSTSRFVNLTESGIARVDFYLARNISRPDSLELNQSIAKLGDFSIQRIASPRNIVFIEDRRLASMKLTGLNFEVGKAVLKPESFVALKQLADILHEYPDQPLIISGHTDSMKIMTPEFPNNKVLSMARAMAVKSYLVEKQGINVDRIRIEGHGENVPLATNKTIEGRSLNRRVEFYFTPTSEEKPLTEMPVAIEIPIEYTGTENITKVDFRDMLDPSFRYVEGSAVFADSAVTPVINGNELHWTLKNLGENFKYKLRYTVMVQRPEVYVATALSSTSASICYFIGDSALKCVDTIRTTNEVAVAVRGRAVNFTMSGVLFDVGKATLRSAALSSLETTAKFLKEDPSSSAMIEGHTDSSPIKTKEYPSNAELSLARANTIKQKLITAFGIAPERLKTVGFGEFRPLASNATKEGKQVNRRIEMRILRSEFSAKVLPEGGIDSSRLIVETLLPKNAPSAMDSLVRDKSKERYILKLEVHRKVKRNTVSTTILDTIPAGLNLIASSIMNVRGVDSVKVNDRVLTIHCSGKDSTIQLYYIAEVAEEGKDEATVIHDYTVQKKQSDGSITEDRSAPKTIEIRKKRMLVRQQR
ncbi:MAG: OmpA family protein, partial [Bacteroidetes bacterium]|nr:OmpA family protein [Bacteroidota bacterium]